MYITNLRVNHLSNPLGFTFFHTVFSWAVEDSKGTAATAMPSGDNMYYVNSLIPFNDYGAFIGEELPRIMQAAFPLSDRREDTFIAGLSMGGFGALRNGFKYADTFGYGHEWDFWDRQIKKVIDWLPLDDAEQGFSSGAID